MKLTIMNRTNVALTNKPDTNYINLTITKAEKVKKYLNEGGILKVVFTQYETIQHKKRKQPIRIISKFVDNIEVLGLRSEVNGKRYHRCKLEGFQTIQECGSNKIKLGTSFSGLGSPEYVLKKLNVEHTNEFCIELDKYSQHTLKQNYNPKKLLSDITKVDESKLPSVNLYVWGSPCQNISRAAIGQTHGRTGLDGPTGRLFWDGYRILKETLPKFSIYENVDDLLTINDGRDYERIIQSFEELKYYKIYSKIVKSLDVGGVTNRNRLFIVLIRIDVKEKFNFPEPESNTNTKCIKDFLIESDDYEYFNEEDFEPYHIPVEEQRGVLKRTKTYLKGKREQTNRVYSEYSPSPTILRNGKIFVDTEKGIRHLTIEEMKRIQGFDDDLSFEGLSNTQIQNQLGNTMEVNTMKKLLSEIVRINNSHNFHSIQEYRSDDIRTKFSTVSNNTNYKTKKVS